MATTIASALAVPIIYEDDVEKVPIEAVGAMSE